VAAICHRRLPWLTLRRIQRHSVSINNAAPIAGISTIAQRQTDVLAALKIKKPSHDAQLSLL
jgi:hypothetical protein